MEEKSIGIHKPEIDRRIEKAVFYLTEEYKKSGHNPKPVVLHSLRTAFYLIENNYDENIVIGAILHDLIEDTNITENDIRSKFGKDIVELVKAVTFDNSIKVKKERYRELFKRCSEAGRDALIIKCADIYDNSLYIRFAEGAEFQEMLIEKVKYFLDTATAISNEKPWQDLYQRYKNELNRIKYL